MMDKNPFLKRLMKAKTKDVVHSSAYAQIQNKYGIGAASTECFAKRMEVDKNRKRVRAYADSKIVNDAFGRAPRPKVYDKTTESPIRKNSGISG